VREAVASVRAQTFTDWEIVIVGDGCDDPMDDLASDPRIDVVHQKRSGVAMARNVGFERCSGRYITFFDHDDIMMPGKLAAQVARFEADPVLGLCHTQFEQVDAELGFLRAGHAADIQYEDLLACHFSLLISTVMVSRTAMECVGGFDPKSQAEDIDFVLKLARTYRLGFVPEVLQQYRRHSRTVSGDPWLQFREVDYVLRGFRRYLISVGEEGSAERIAEGRRTNRRVNAEIAVLRARSDADRSRPGLGAVAKNLGLAFLLSPQVVVGNGRALIDRRVRAPR
jgi:glycosyltransferase involved in cell wall biosynthesis